MENKKRVTEIEALNEYWSTAIFSYSDDSKISDNYCFLNIVLLFLNNVKCDPCQDLIPQLIAPQFALLPLNDIRCGLFSLPPSHLSVL